jgi:hypothetical protein
MPDTLSARDAFGHWLSGFCDGEASFNLNIGAKQVSSQFTLKLRADELPILEEIRSFWGGIGSLTVQKPRKGCPSPIAVYQVVGIRDLPTVVNHFKRFPLRSRKAGDFPHWRSGVLLHALVSQSDTVSRGYNQGMFPKWSSYYLERYRQRLTALHAGRVFREVEAVAPVVAFDEGFRHWMAGFIAAEGCLRLKIPKDVPRSMLIVKLRADDLPTLLILQNFFGGGSIRRDTHGPSKPRQVYETGSPARNHDRVIPFLQSYPLRAKKAAEVPIWIQAASICYEASIRPVQRLRSLHLKPNLYSGTLPRWQPADREAFAVLHAAIRNLRPYREAD